jgi:acid phosphatase type 7
MRKPVLLLTSMALAGLLAASMAAVLTAVPGVGQTATTTLVGAGDIASCNYSADSATARLLGRIPGTVYTLGDNAYPNGSRAQFANCYDPTWGRYKNRTKPTAGNHDYHTIGASPYFRYFGSRAGLPGAGFYSYKRGSWHIVALNSNCDQVGGCARLSPQGRWLRDDLANHPARCTLAYFHHPLYASGTGSDTPKVEPLWRILYNRGADVILSGHAHRYERFRPINPDGDPDSVNGIRQFIVGTGGAPSLGQSGPNDPNMQRKKLGTPGVLRLNLGVGSYSWKFVHIAGETFTDWGSDQCH